MRALFLTLLAVSAAGCDSKAENAVVQGPRSDQQMATRGDAVQWPDSLKPFGDGYPNAGDPCRRVGESAATSDYLDDSAALVGCPTSAQASTLGGRVVATVDGITLVSVSGDARQSDALVPGTAYHATAELPCSLRGKTGSCRAGVKRAPDQIGVEVTSLEGTLRTLLFDGSGKFITHSSSEADGSASLQSSARRDDDWTVVTLGTEEYRVPDALLLGG